MAASLAALATVGGLVARMRDVDVLTVRLEADSLWGPGSGDQPCVDVHVHAADYEAAELVAERWGLIERVGRVTTSESSQSGRRWRVWSGWVPELSGGAVVWLSVTAAGRCWPPLLGATEEDDDLAGAGIA